ncbi:Restriction enzyme BgcI subunit beta [termite gut metagenome]|uniref:Restriction enzyme BgcI subunit beta n=1 Tax=termite gut metagenome TaxID=433724 RepID=A0A5J4RUG1_9ZZZZ
MNELIKVSDLFNITYGNSLELIHLDQCKSVDSDAIPFVSRTEKNNGVSAFVYRIMDIEPNPAHTLSVAVGGSVLSTFYQPLPYYTGFHVLVLSPLSPMNIIEMLFYARCISNNRYKYNYGRQANKTLKDILIPERVSPELAGRLSNYKSTIEQRFKKTTSFNQKIKLNNSDWESFLIADLFKITGTKTTSCVELEEYGKGKYPYVTTQSTNNGVENFYDFYTEEGNVLTIDSAVTGYCSYQPISFSASDHVEKLMPKNIKMNPYIALFLVTILNCEQYRYNYGRKASQARLKETTIKLPVTKERQPDWLLMENFIKSLPYSYAMG